MSGTGAGQRRVREVLESVVGRLERADALDAPGYQLEHGLALSFLLAGPAARPLQDLLHGVWLGHPLHPVLVTVPVGSWTAALLLDGLEAAGRETGGAATAVVALGVAGALASAATGMTDWQHAHDGARRVGLVHAALNTGALALYAWSLADRAAGRRGRARLTATAGWAVTAASSYLGGTLSYRHLLGTDHADRSTAPRQFRPVADVRAARGLPDGEVLGVEADGVPVVLVADGGTLRALGGRCPHMGAPLAEGWVHRGDLVCPWHGSRFRLADGQPSQGPSTAPLPCLDVRERDGRVERRRRAEWRSATSSVPAPVTTRQEASR